MDPKLLNPAAGMPRTDYPRPQWMRKEWFCLNGRWDFAFDFGNSGIARRMEKQGEYPLQILVPFCPESRLSGIGYIDFIPAVWYRRNLQLDQLTKTLAGKRALLHFGAVDYKCQVWVNGISCGSHTGGYASFTFDITDALQDGENMLVVYAQDDQRSGKQPHGKQCQEYISNACSYTRTTGIWQSVWMELVPEKYLSYAKMIPSAVDGRISVQIQGVGTVSGDRVRLRAKYEGREVGQTIATFAGNLAKADLSVSEKHLWDPGEPELYDLTLELLEESGAVTDEVESYFALRDVALTDRALTINGKPVFMRTILDQGFNPEGIYTAPDDTFLKRDIELSMELGFNGARLHQRVFEERTLYWADRLGYLVWGEFPSGGDLGSCNGIAHVLPEWLEVMRRDFNHPSLIGWCPFNETYHLMVLEEQTHKVLYQVTKAYDPTRPVIDASGGVHYDTDMFDVHDYEQDPEVFRAYFEPMKEDPMVYHNPVPRYTGDAPTRPMEYKGQPYWVSEYGGTLWNPSLKEGEDGWGYGDAPRTEEEFADRYERLTGVLLSHPRICGFSYTQLTDIEQEQNGLYYYDRSRKFPAWVYERIKKANTAKAAIEFL